ncbi:MAG: ABC transporter permease [Xenophilus sp.]
MSDANSHHAADGVAAARFTRPSWPHRLLRPQPVLAALIVLSLLCFAMADADVLAEGNLANILTQASFLALFASAQALVILTRGFDLSLGTTVSVTSVVAAMAAVAAGPELAVPTAVLAGVLVGLLIGFVNGGLVAWAGINPFVATLGTTSVLASVAATISGGFPVAGLPDGFAVLAAGRVTGIPLPILLAGLALGGLQLMLLGGRLGRSLALVGSNPQAAHVAGLGVRWTRTTAYLLCSVLAALGAVMLTSRTGSGEPNLGGSLTLETIAAAVVGGMSLRGGEGSIGAPLLGALFVTVLSNGMNLVQVDGYLQQVLLGLVIVASLAIDRWRAAS